MGLAERLGVGQSYVSKIERGEAFVEVLQFVRWCEACNAVPSQVLSALRRALD